MDLPKTMFQMISFRNFFEMRNSSTRSCCKLASRVSFKPHILTPFMDESIADVAEMRFSIASSHIAWRDMMKFMANMEPNNETALG
jgi:hypothetical protein